MSSKKQDKSIPAQREALLALAKRKGYRIVREYVDTAVSGDETEKRSGFLRLRKDCENGPDFSIILVWHEDRFSRNDPLELGWWVKPIRDSGVVIETPTGQVDWDTLGGRLIYLIGQEMRHDYLRTLSRNVTRGQLAAAKNGRKGTGGRSPSGYQRDGDQIVVDPDRAAVIRRIFEEYNKPEASLRSVVDLLNREEIPTVTGKNWGRTTVRTILRNRKYVGDFVRFRYRCGKYHAVDAGEIVPRTRADKWSEAEPMVVEENHEPIVERDLFERVQRKLGRQQRRTAPKSKRRYVLSGLIRCGDCGAAMTGQPFSHTSTEGKRTLYNLYMCSSYKNKGKSACNSNSIVEARLLDCVVRKIQGHYLSDLAIDRLQKKIRKQQEATRRRIIPVDSKRLRKRIEDLDRRIEQGAERVFSAPETIVDRLYAKLDGLRREREQLGDQLKAAEAPGKCTQRQDDQEVEAALETLRELRTAIKDADPADLRELLALTISRIELHYSHSSNGKRTKNTFEYGTIFVRPDPAISNLFATAEI